MADPINLTTYRTGLVNDSPRAIAAALRGLIVRTTNLGMVGVADEPTDTLARVDPDGEARRLGIAP